MRIREQTEIAVGDRLERQQSVVEAIAELERQADSGEIEEHAYLIKKRALIRML